MQISDLNTKKKSVFSTNLFAWFIILVVVGQQFYRRIIRQQILIVLRLNSLEVPQRVVPVRRRRRRIVGRGGGGGRGRGKILEFNVRRLVAVPQQLVDTVRRPDGRREIDVLVQHAEFTACRPLLQLLLLVVLVLLGQATSSQVHGGAAIAPVHLRLWLCPTFHWVRKIATTRYRHAVREVLECQVIIGQERDRSHTRYLELAQEQTFVRLLATFSVAA